MINDRQWLESLLVGIFKLVEQLQSGIACNSWLQGIEVIGQIRWE